jgi:hypothetical protein
MGAGSTESSGCPFADPALGRQEILAATGPCPFHGARHTEAAPALVTRPVRVNIVRGTHVGDTDSAALLRDIGGGDRIREMCTRFYGHFFLDSRLQQFRCGAQL